MPARISCCCFSLLLSHASRHFTLSAPLWETERTNERTNEEGTSINLGRRKQAREERRGRRETTCRSKGMREGRRPSSARLSVSTLNYARIGRRRRWTARDARGGAFCTPRSRSRRQSACSLARSPISVPVNLNSYRLSSLPPSLPPSRSGLLCCRATKPTASFPRCSLPSRHCSGLIASWHALPPSPCCKHLKGGLFRANSQLPSSQECS